MPPPSSLEKIGTPASLSDSTCSVSIECRSSMHARLFRRRAERRCELSETYARAGKCLQLARRASPPRSSNGAPACSGMGDAPFAVRRKAASTCLGVALGSMREVPEEHPLGSQSAARTECSDLPDLRTYSVFGWRDRGEVLADSSRQIRRRFLRNQQASVVSNRTKAACIPSSAMREGSKRISTPHSDIAAFVPAGLPPNC